MITLLHPRKQRRPIAWWKLLFMAVTLSAAADPADPPDRFERPGLVADRASRTVRVQAATTNVGPREPMEFFLVHRRSGHDYEAFAVTDVLPSEIHQALRFIGLEPGRHVDPERLRFWPEGPRVSIRVEPAPGGEESNERPPAYAAEETVLDLRTGNPLPRQGFTFTGSVWLHEDSRVEGDGYASDVLDPHAIVTFFNLPTTVLDVPRRAPQGAVYDVQVKHPDRTAPEGTDITIVFEALPPPHPDGLRLDLGIRVDTDGDGRPVFRVSAGEGTVAVEGNAPDVVAWITDRTREDREVWITITFDEDLALSGLAAAATVMDDLATRHEVRIQPPPQGTLYYQSFLPNPGFRDRAGRPAQPWEVRLRREPEGWAGHMVRHQRDYTASLETGERVFREPVEAPVRDPDALRDTLDRDPSEVRVLLVFAPEDVRLRELNTWLREALTTHPVVFIFADEP